MKDRIRKLRKTLGLNQTDFGAKIGVRRSTIAAYEAGNNFPLDTVIQSICRVYSVREAWLRYGEGEMFEAKPRNEALKAGLEQVLTAGDDDFRARLISVLLELPPEQWAVLEKVAVEAVNRRQPAEPENVHDWTPEQVRAEVDRQLDGEAGDRKRGPDGTSGSSSNGSGAACG